MQSAGVAGTLIFLAAGALHAQEAPSFDCKRASSEAEKAVCNDAELAQLDREMARLYQLALNGPHLTAELKRILVATERGWIKGRDDCWKAPDLLTCIRTEYVIGIADLRQGYADARVDDGAGISIGPLVTECPGLAALITTVFVNSDPAVVYLAWLDHTAVLDQTPSGSGAKYEATLADGYYLYWNKGDTAQLEIPGIEGTLRCTVGEGG